MSLLACIIAGHVRIVPSNARRRLLSLCYSILTRHQIIMMTSSNGNIFPHYWPFVRGIHQSRGICTWTNNWANSGDPDDLRCHRAHYDVSVMWIENRPRRRKVYKSKGQNLLCPETIRHYSKWPANSINYTWSTFYGDWLCLLMFDNNLPCYVISPQYCDTFHVKLTWFDGLTWSLANFSFRIVGKSRQNVQEYMGWILLFEHSHNFINWM